MAAMRIARHSGGRGCRSPTRRTSTSSSRCSRGSSAARSAPDEWRAFRLLRGTYGQRQTGDAQMLRVKIPQGILAARSSTRWRTWPSATRAASATSRRGRTCSSTSCKLHDVEPAMRELADAGMTTREACGNSVRNITACPYAGVAADEPFDVTPYAEALTRYLLRHPLSASLPRKFKIAFEGCARRSHRHGDQRHRLHARVADGRRPRSPRLPRHRRRRHGDDGAGRATCSTSSCRSARCSTSPKRSSASSTGSATTSTSSGTA